MSSQMTRNHTQNFHISHLVAVWDVLNDMDLVRSGEYVWIQEQAPTTIDGDHNHCEIPLVKPRNDPLRKSYAVIANARNPCSSAN